MRKSLLIVIGLSCLFTGRFFAQDKHALDSIKVLLKAASEDTERVKQSLALFALSFPFDKPGIDTASLMALNYAKDLTGGKWKGKGILARGQYLKEEENYDSAQICMIEALRYFDPDKNKKEMGNANSYLGYFQEKLEHWDKAIDYHRLALKFRIEMQDANAISISHMRLGTCFSSLHQSDSAMKHFRQAIAVLGTNAPSTSLGNIYNNFAILFKDMKMNDSALYYYRKGLVIYRQIQDSLDISAALINIGDVYLTQHKNDSAEKYLMEGYLIAKKIDHLEWIRNCAGLLSDLYESENDFSNALFFLKEKNAAADSLNSANNFHTMTEMEAKYQNEKNSADLEKKDLLLKQQNRLKIIFAAGFLITLILFAFLYKNFREKKKANAVVLHQKEEVESQRDLIEEKNRQITDSINYAKRIQSSLIPEEKEFTRHFTDAFIFFQPKDIVSGDFFWILEKGDELFFVIADCTGHGVPGGFMTMLGISYLEEIVGTRNVTSPAQIINILRDKLIRTLHQTGGSDQTKDGMDLVMCRLNKKSRILTFAGAHNSLYVVGNGDLKEFRTDKQPCGYHEQMKDFSEHEIMIQKGQWIYLFTDGFADQFGGQQGKKFKYKQLEKLLKDNDRVNGETQRRYLEREFVQWKKDLEQVDDVLVAGIHL